MILTASVKIKHYVTNENVEAPMNPSLTVTTPRWYFISGSISCSKPLEPRESKIWEIAKENEIHRIDKHMIL